jgi:hypothetical protein
MDARSVPERILLVHVSGHVYWYMPPRIQASQDMWMVWRHSHNKHVGGSDEWLMSRSGR